MSIRDTNLSPLADEFLEVFLGYIISSLINFFSSYDQVKLNKKFQNLTIFMTSLGLIHMITFLQDTTNSIAQFIQIAFKILTPH